MHKSVLVTSAHWQHLTLNERYRKTESFFPYTFIVLKWLVAHILVLKQSNVSKKLSFFPVKAFRVKTPQASRFHAYWLKFK